MKMNRPMTQRAALHYLLAAAVFSLYGARVCPFIDSLSALQTSSYALITFLTLFIIRTMVIKEQTGLNALIKELTLFSLGAVGLAVWYNNQHQFPLESNLKVIIGIICLGALVTVDLILQAQVKNYPNNTLQTSDTEFGAFRYSIAIQMAGLVIFIVVMLTAVLSMIVAKDIHWLAENLTVATKEAAMLSVIKEFIFVAMIIIAYTSIIMFHWLKLLTLLLKNQQRVLIEASNGDLSVRVPVIQQGELGVIAHYTNEMLSKLAQSYEEVTQTRDVAIVGLSTLAESRDNETGGHILRTQEYVCALANQLKSHPNFKTYLTNSTIELLYKSAPLHDIGKVGIPDAILLKPGKLTDDEFIIMKTHATIGADAIAVAEKEMGSNSFLSIAREIALTHHEKWDGSGYPNRLKGDDIPLSGRLMALADVYDALISKRVYKPAFSHDKAKSIILEGVGIHFDPVVVDAFIACEDKFVTIALNHQDENSAE